MNDNDLKRLFRHATTEYLEEERDLCRATILNLKKAELWKVHGHRKIDNQIKDLMISVSFIGRELERRNRAGE
jgi:hypothetical protein